MTVTSCCPLGGFIFVSQNTSESPADYQVGSGNFASEIAWGTVTGWTVTGSFFCHSDPSYLCNFLEAMDLATVDLPQYSSFYDLGTWTFHGTGFSATPFIHSRLPPPNNAYNSAWILRGRQLTGSVPAVSSFGILALSGAFVALAWMRMHRAGHRS